MLFILIMILFIIFILTVIFIAFLLEYNKITKNYILLNFSQFKKFYTINPTKWNLDWLTYRIRYYTEEKYPYDIAIKGYLEYLFLFKPFKRKIKKEASQKENDKQLQCVLTDIRKDIHELEKQSQKEIKDANNMMKAVR